MREVRTRIPAILAAALSIACAAAGGVSVDGVSDTEVLIGQCAALSGPARALGIGMNDGLRAAFEEANSKGGI